MPRKAQQNTDPIGAFVQASQAFAQAKHRLQEAVAANTLNAEQRAYYQLLKDGLSLQHTPRPVTRKELAAKPTTENSGDSVFDNKK